MSYPGTFWLTVINIALAGVIVICLAAIWVGVVREIVWRARKRRAIFIELDQDMAELFGSLPGGAQRLRTSKARPPGNR